MVGSERRAERNVPTLWHTIPSVLAVLVLILITTSSSRFAVAFSTPASASASTPIDMAERPSQYYASFCERLPSLEGKTVVITGCSRGLGFITARTVASKGGRIIALNRASERSTRALEQISERSGAGPPPTLVECDLTSFASVKSACRKVKEMTKDDGGIDILCCNAGVMLQLDTATVDGYDLTASTNMLSHFLIVKELFPYLQTASAQSGESRVVTMSSASGYGDPPLDTRFFEQRGGALGGDTQSSYARYHQSKLANLAFATALDRKMREGSSGNVLSLACTPGVCGSDMFLHATRVMSGRPTPRDRVPSVEDGALAQLKCIFDPDIESGQLWGPSMGGRGDEFGLQNTVIGPPEIMVTQKSCDAVWKACEDAVGTFNI